VRAALDIGRLVRAVDYIHAQRVREGLRREVSELYAPYDAVLMPAMGIDRAPASSRGRRRRRQCDVGARGKVHLHVEPHRGACGDGAMCLLALRTAAGHAGRVSSGRDDLACAWGLRRGVLVDSAL